MTESQGRIHTSAATVMVLPEADEVEVSIDQADLRVDVFRSTGPGGQSVNTTDSAVRITHLPTGIVVSMQDEKSQIQNRARALQVLRARLLKLEQDRVAAEQSEQRRSQVGGGGRSEKIRTYNFKENRVTDHRVKLTLHKLDRVLEGDLDEIVDALIADERIDGRGHWRAYRWHPRSVGDLLGAASAALGSAQESRWIVAHAAGMSAGDLVARPDTVVAPAVSDAVAGMVQRRLSGEPLQYVLGTWAFRGAGGPRRSTRPHPASRDRAGGGGGARRAPGPGRSSGAGNPTSGRRSRDRIGRHRAVSRLRARPLAALAGLGHRHLGGRARAVHRESRRRSPERNPRAAARVRVARGSWFEALPPEVAGELHVVVSNPPYVSAAEWEVLEAGGPRATSPSARSFPAPPASRPSRRSWKRRPDGSSRGGASWWSCAPAQADVVRTRAAELGYGGIEVHDDLAGRPRQLVARSSRR